jgi:sialate O-acetylesterase
VGKEALLHLAEIDDADTTWVNGVKVGETDVWTTRRNYRIPVGGLKAGRNVITVRVLDTGGNGGFMGREGQLKLDTPGEPPVPLAGEWHCREGCSLAKVPAPPQKPGESPNTPTVLYNAMIAPLQAFPIKGVVWYQGESNNGRTKQYQKLFPLLIADWRRVWRGGNFPFLFVQIAPYRDMSPEIREAQFLTLKKSPYTAMAVITDAGDADDIHPARKEVPGERLALAARALAYKEKLEFSGPLFKAMKIEGGKAVVSFTHTGGGLMAKDGELKGFTIAGADKKFVPAKAEIKGRTVVISSGEISSPTAVRYGWSNVPDVNLYNQEGLPASPFRSDVADY